MNDKKNEYMGEIHNKDEYLMLREEIIFHLNKTHELRNMMYISSIAILAFIYKEGNEDGGLLYLLPFAVIIPSYFISLRHSESLRIISSYMEIFLEGDIFNWETRYKKFLKIAPLREQRVKIVDWSYFAMSLICFLFSFLKTNNNERYVLIIFLVGISLLCLLTYIGSKEKIRNKWRELKRQECNDRIATEIKDSCDDILDKQFR